MRRGAVVVVVGVLAARAAMGQDGGVGEEELERGKMPTVFSILGVERTLTRVEGTRATLTLPDGGAPLQLDVQALAELKSMEAALDAEKKKSEAAAERASEAESEKSRISSGKLISSGVTGGVGFSVVAPLSASGTDALTGNKLLVAEVAAMPYLALVPAYWFLNNAARDYCASQFTSGSEDDAARAANSIVLKKAERMMQVVEVYAGVRTAEDLRERLKADFGPFATLFQPTGMAEQVHADQALLNQTLEFLRAKGKARDAARANLVRLFAAKDWDATKPAKCGWTKLALWAGVPATFSVRSQVPSLEQPDANRSFRPVIAFGAGFVPNAYVAVLLGVTHGNLIVDENETSKGTAYAAWGWTIGLGGNLDLVQLLTSLGKGN